MIFKKRGTLNRHINKIVGLTLSKELVINKNSLTSQKTIVTVLSHF